MIGLSQLSFSRKQKLGLFLKYHIESWFQLQAKGLFVANVSVFWIKKYLQDLKKTIHSFLYNYVLLAMIHFFPLIYFWQLILPFTTTTEGLVQWFLKRTKSSCPSFDSASFRDIFSGGHNFWFRSHISQLPHPIKIFWKKEQLGHEDGHLPANNESLQ